MERLYTLHQKGCTSSAELVTQEMPREREKVRSPSYLHSRLSQHSLSQVQYNFQLPLMTAKFHSLNPSVSVRDGAILKIPRSSSRPSRLLNYDNLRELNAVSAKCSG